MQLSKTTRQIISELLSVGDLCRHDKKVCGVVTARVQELLHPDTRGPWLLSDASIEKVYADLVKTADA